MSLRVRVTRETGHLVLKAEGVYSLSNFQALVDRVAAESSKSGCASILLDVSEVMGDVPATDSYFLGEYASKAWRQPMRVAVVHRAQGVEGLFADVAAEDGARTFVASEAATALDWLMKKAPEGKPASPE